MSDTATTNPDHAAARWVTTALQSWMLSRDERQFDQSGAMGDHLWLALDEALAHWGDRPLPFGAPPAVSVLSEMGFIPASPEKPHVEQAAHRVVHALARNANAWTHDKKHNPIKPGKKSQAVMLLQLAMESGNKTLVEGLLSDPDAPPGAVDAHWWKLPGNLTHDWIAAIMGPQSNKRGGVSLTTLALARSHQAWKNQHVHLAAKVVLANADFLAPATPASTPLLALCSSFVHLPRALSGVEMTPATDAHLLAASRLGHPGGLRHWFRALHDIDPATATRMAPRLLDESISSSSSLSRLGPQKASVLLDTWVDLLAIADLDFEHDPLPQSGLSPSHAMARFAALDPHRNATDPTHATALSAWARLSDDHGAAPAMDKAGMYWLLWALPDRQADAEHKLFFDRAWNHPDRAQALLEAARSPDAALMLPALTDLLTLDSNTWPAAERVQVLDAWAEGMLHIQPRQVGPTIARIWDMYDARYMGEPLPDQWQPILAMLGAPLPRPCADATIDPARMLVAIDAWCQGCNLNEKTMASMQSLRLQWTVPAIQGQARAGPRL